jgi:uncharacterized protein (TIGR02453 family)
MGSEFRGFGPDALGFLVELGLNNERSWFQPRKGRYEALLKEPLEALCAALDKELRARDVPFRADPARSPFRIYRDVRFSRDKAPYKTNVGASFPWAGEGGGVGGYFHLEPGAGFTGGGMYHPSPARLAAWRNAIVTEREAVHAAIEDPAFVATFGPVNAESSLKRAPSGFDPGDPDIELLKLKDVIFGRPLSDADVESPDLPVLLADSLAASVPVMRFLANLPGLDEPSSWLRG